MHATSFDRRSATARVIQPCMAHIAYLEFLQAHGDSCTRGQPLLTEAGVAYLYQRLQSGAVTPVIPDGPRPTSPQPGESSSILPFWYAEGRQLWLGDHRLKVFRQPAPNQTRILDVFQEQGWATMHIDDPLPPSADEGEQEAKQRLHDTIKNLNRGLPPETIHFRGDGTGQGVVWEYSK